MGGGPPIDKSGMRRDIPPMSATIIDQKRRVVLPGVQPGDARSVNQDAAGRLVLVRLLPERPKRKPMVPQVGAAILKKSLKPTLSWAEGRRIQLATTDVGRYHTYFPKLKPLTPRR